jgi:hypothetical protein
MRTHRTIAAAALLAAVLVTGSASAASAAPVPVPCKGTATMVLRGSTMDIIQLRTFTVVVKPLAKVYKVGSTAKVAVTVTRPAHRDPLQLGPEFEPPASFPAADVSVGIGIHVGDTFVPGFGITDEDGKATVGIKLPGYMNTGPAEIDGYAWKIQADSPCLTIEEDGYTHMDNGFVVKK